MAAPEEVNPSYTVFIRLPFPRGEFVDPPPVEWDATKDRSLWKILSKASKNSDIDWNALATKFDVSLAFLLQQAAWLYERQFSQVRAQLRKVGAKAAPSPVLGVDSTGGEAMKRTGSGGGGPRAPSSLSARKDSPLPKIETSVPGTPSRSTAPPLSRTSSTGTAVQSRLFLPNSPRPSKTIPARRSLSPISKPRPTPLNTTASPATRADPSSPSEPAESSSSESSSDSDVPVQSRLLRRPPRFSRSEDADDDDSPTFLPFSNPIDQETSKGPSVASRAETVVASRRIPAKKSNEAVQVSQTSDSSASSAATPSRPQRKDVEQSQRPSGPLFSRRTDELAGRSPLSKGKGREGSDGTPSMGSSFSDLDDASVTQSALEEALASNMQHGGMASRMSSISQALRSRYL